MKGTFLMMLDTVAGRWQVDGQGQALVVTEDLGADMDSESNKPEEFELENIRQLSRP